MTKITVCNFDTKLEGERMKEGEKKRETYKQVAVKRKERNGRRKMERWIDILSLC